jgi:hypothetical protein
MVNFLNRLVLITFKKRYVSINNGKIKLRTNINFLATLIWLCYWFSRACVKSEKFVFRKIDFFFTEEK